jgi:DNA-binding NarL/FixJ family response regulator
VSTRTSTRARVVVVDDQRMFAEGLTRIIDAADDLAVVAVAAGGAELDAVAPNVVADVVVLDYRLGDDSALGLVPLIGARWPDARVLVATGFDSEHTRQQVRAAGCHGFVSKDESSTALLHAIRVLAAGGEVGFDPCGRDGDALTQRELEVLALLAEGCSAAEIADRLFIGVVTVRNHVQRILRKLDASTQLEAVIIGMRRGLVDPPTPVP